MILVVGEALVDVVQRPDGSTAQHAGGSPANVAVGLGRLGIDVTLVASLGDDRYGQLIRAHLDAHGVRLANQPVTRTASAIAHLGDDGSATYDFDIAWDPGRIDLPNGVTVVHTGSIGATLAPGAADVEDLVRRLAPSAIVTFDPNVRPTLIDDDREDAVARTERFITLADVVKVSVEDVAWLRPEEAPDDVACGWAEAGPAIVVLTRGAQGSTAFTRSGRVDAAAAPTRVVDTIGAGDSFMAGLITALHDEGLLKAAERPALRTIDRETLTRVTSFATRAAAWVVSRSGAQSPSREQLSP